MITWEQPVNASAIAGTPIGRSASYAAGGIVNNEQVSLAVSFEEEYDWFNGLITGKTERSDDRFPIAGLLTSFGDVWGENGEFTSQTITFQDGPASETISNGSRTLAAPGIVGEFDGEDGGATNEEFSLVDFTATFEDTDWSRATVTLNSYELTTLTGLTGLTTTEVVSLQTWPTTSLSGDEIFTVSSEFEVSATMETVETTFTKATWQPSEYSTTFGTGQTVAVFYSSFSHEIPATFSNSLSTQTSVVEPLSFVALSGYSDTQDGVSATQSTFTVSNVSKTASTAGASVADSTNPRTVTAFNAISTSQGGVLYTITQTTVYNGLFETAPTPARIVSTTEVEFAGGGLALTQFQTETVGDFAEGYSETFLDGPLSITQAGLQNITPTNLFGTERIATISALQQITVGVRADSNGEAGGAIEDVGRGQQFYLHSSSVVFPATASTVRDSTSFTFSGNSYTAKDTGGGETQSVFGVVGDSVSQYVSLGVSQSNAASATVLGGPIPGEAVIANGRYATFCGEDSGFSSPQFALKINWTASAETTAWLPAFRAETVGANTGVVAISRHSFTQIVDD
jgi:hypothetical protein